MADEAGTTTEANPTPAGFDLGKATNDLLSLASAIVTRYTNPTIQSNAAPTTAAPAQAVSNQAGTSPAGWGAANLLWIAGIVGLLWLLFRK